MPFLTRALISAPFIAIALAGPASAHVTVQPPTAEQGADDASIAFRVPNELDSATTVKVQVKFPTDTPLASVSTTPVAGWTVDVQKTTLTAPIKTDDGDVTSVVATITWTATGTGIGQGQYQDFDLSVGPVPGSVSALSFPTLQTYSDGTVVSWIDPVGPDAEHPTPTLQLVPGSEAAADPSASPSVTVAPVTGAQNFGYVAGSSAKDSTARTLGIVGIAVGAFGLGIAAVAVRRKV